MTICLGALCADNNGTPQQIAVAASDRMVTLGGLIEFEHEVPKVSAINQFSVALIAGDALRGTRIVKDVANQFANSAPLVQQVADFAAKVYAEHRRQKINADYYLARGFTIEEFYRGLQQQLQPQLAFQIDQATMAFDYTVEMLIAGADAAGTHLYSVSNPGSSINDHEPIGYHAIGSGALHALQSMIGFRHTAGHPLAETLFSVYASKRRAEVAPGVGTETDMFIIDRNGIHHLDPQMLARLDHLYREYQKPITEKLRAQITELVPSSPQAAAPSTSEGAARGAAESEA